MTQLVGNINVEQKNGQLVVKSENSIFCESFYFQGFYDDSLIKKFIKSTEILIRSSKEYTDYLTLIKTNYNVLNYDNIQSSIGSADASIEMHHYPFSLYEIVETVMSDHFMNNINFTSFSLAKDVMDLHFSQKIGLVPLTTTNHQLSHSGNFIIKESQIFGNWKDFYKKYEKSISAELIEKIKELDKISEDDIPTDIGGIY